MGVSALSPPAPLGPGTEAHMRSRFFAVAVFSLLFTVPSLSFGGNCGLTCQTGNAYNNLQGALNNLEEIESRENPPRDDPIAQAARQAARQEAREKVVSAAAHYLKKEGAYQRYYGRPYNEAGFEGAQTIMRMNAANQKESNNGGNEGEVDSRGVPVVGEGRNVSDNTKFTGEASGEVSELDGKDELGTTYTRDEFAESSANDAGPSKIGSDGSDSSELMTFGSGTGFGNNTSGGSSAGMSAGPQAAGPASGERTGGSVESKSASAMRAAETRLLMGNLTGALLAVEKAVSANPLDPEAHTLKAKILNRMGRHRDAALSAQAALRLDPGSLSAHRENAWALLNTKDYDAALAAADQMLRIDPNNAAAYAIKAFAYEQLGDRKRMLIALETAARLAPHKYRKYLERALAGERLFRPGEKDNWRLLEGAPYEAPRGGPSLVHIGAILIGLAGLIIGLIMWRRGSSVPPAAESPAAAAVPGELIAGKYRMTRVIGKGGMGHIYEASDESLGRTVAIKKFIFDEISPDRARKSALREAQTVAQVRHPGIVDIIEVLDRPEGLFLVFELLTGKTVEQIILEKKQMPLADVKRVLASVCAALEFAHSKGIIHRDLKPSNIMLTQEGYVKILDFGIARQNEVAAPVGGAPAGSGGALSAHTRGIAGTPEYMSPEAMKGEISPASDVYSLGVCLYEMLTGELPMRPPNREYVPAVLRVPGMPPQFDEMIRAALETDPKNRTSNVRTFAQQLEVLPEKTPTG